MKLLLLVLVVPLIGVVAVANGVESEGPEEGYSLDSTGATDEPLNTPFDMPGNRMLNFEDGNEQNEIELRNSVNTTTAQPSDDCENNGGECKKNKKQCKATINKDYTCSKKGVCCVEEPAQTTGCPEGFFLLAPSSQCFKFFNDQKRSWFEANSKCQSEGLVSAKPSDPVILQKYLVNKYGYDTSKGWPFAWIPARGSGSSYFIWQPTGAWNSSGARIYYSNPYFYSAPSSSSTFSTSYCIYMLNYGSAMKSYPGKPYSWSTCTGRYYYTICELVKE